MLDVAAKTPHHRYLITTKYPCEIAPTLARMGRSLPGNVWLSVSVESVDYLNRIDDLRSTAAAIKMVHFEPLLGSVGAVNLDGINGVVVGPERGTGARPCSVEWVREIQALCAAQNIPFSFMGWPSDKSNPLAADFRKCCIAGEELRDFLRRVAGDEYEMLLDGTVFDQFPIDPTWNVDHPCGTGYIERPPLPDDVLYLYTGDDDDDGYEPREPSVNVSPKPPAVDGADDVPARKADETVVGDHRLNEDHCESADAPPIEPAAKQMDRGEDNSGEAHADAVAAGTPAPSANTASQQHAAGAVSIAAAGPDVAPPIEQTPDEGALSPTPPPSNTLIGSLLRASSPEQLFGYTSSGALTYWFDGKPHFVDNVSVRSDGYKHINVRDYLDREAGENYPDGSYYISTAAALPPDFPIPPLNIATDDGDNDDGPGGGSPKGPGSGQSECADKQQLGAAPSPPATRGHGRHPDDNGPGGAHPRRPESPPNGDPGAEARLSARSADVSALIRRGRPEFYQSRPYLPRSEIATLALSASPITYPFPWLGEDRVRRVDVSLRPQSVEHYVRAGLANWQIVTAVATESVIQIIDAFKELAPLGRQDEAPGNNRGDGKNWRIIARWLTSDGALIARIKVLGRTDACRDILIADSVAADVDLIDGQTAVECDAEALAAELRRAYGVTDLPFKAARDVQFEGPGIVLQLNQLGIEIHRACGHQGSVSSQDALPHLGILRNQRRHWEYGRTTTPSAPVRLSGAPPDVTNPPTVTPESK